MTTLLLARRQGEQFLCGIKRCRGVLGEYWEGEVLGQPGRSETRWRRQIVLPSLLVKHEDDEGTLWEEPQSRRKARMRGLRSEHHLTGPKSLVGPFYKPTPGSPPIEMPRAMVDLEDGQSVRVRCPRCRWINHVRLLLDSAH